MAVTKVVGTEVSREQLKLGTGEASFTVGAGGTGNVAMHRTTFYPSKYQDASPRYCWVACTSGAPNDYIGYFGVKNESSANMPFRIKWEYITASNKPFVYKLFDTSSNLVGIWYADDPPEVKRPLILKDKENRDLLEKGELTEKIIRPKSREEMFKIVKKAIEKALWTET